MLWRNGGGETREIAVHPAGADTASFEWRVSMARVAADGPFSVFEGVDRVLAVLEGDELELSISGREALVLTPRSDPLAFPADVPTAARLPCGPIVDLNVMVRRGSFAARVERFGDDAELPAMAGATLVFALGPLAIEVEGVRFDLAREDALLCDGEAMRASGEAGGYRISMPRHGP